MEPFAFTSALAKLTKSFDSACQTISKVSINQVMIPQESAMYDIVASKFEDACEDLRLV